ncbi:MAG: hypothetical protein QMD10_11515 [Desulfitobacteriaceae bacterium]|nr:hypothetical protein [Desulfitobacteriaceae bacterium]
MSLQTLIWARKAQLAAEKAAQEAARKAAAEAALRERLAQVEEELKKEAPLFIEAVRGQVPRVDILRKDVFVEEEVSKLQLLLKSKCMSLADLERNYRSKRKEVEKEKARLEKQAGPLRRLLEEARELGLQNTPEFKSEQFKLLAIEQKEKELDRALEEARRKKNRAFGQALGLLKKLRSLGGEPLATCQWFVDRVDGKPARAANELTVALGEVAAGLAAVEVVEQPPVEPTEKEVPAPKKEQAPPVLKEALRILRPAQIGLKELADGYEAFERAVVILKRKGWDEEKMDRFLEEAAAEAERLGLI